MFLTIMELNPQPMFTPLQKRLLARAITVMAFLFLTFALVLGLYLFIKLLSLLNVVLIPLILAALISFILFPVVRYLQRLGLSRNKSIILIYLFLIASIVITL